MIDLYLKRVWINDDGTFGVLIFNDVPFALTLEETWKDNEKNISCIPVGTYVCERIKSPRFGDTFEIKSVPGRTHILFHSLNTEIDTEGCIGIGEEFGYLKALDDDTGQIEKQPAILSSRRGFNEFMNLFRNYNKFILKISMS